MGNINSNLRGTPDQKAWFIELSNICAILFFKPIGNVTSPSHPDLELSELIENMKGNMNIKYIYIRLRKESSLMPPVTCAAFTGKQAITLKDMSIQKRCYLIQYYQVVSNCRGFCFKRLYRTL